MILKQIARRMMSQKHIISNHITLFSQNKRMTQKRFQNNTNLQSQVQNKNSIMPKPEQGYAYGHHFPPSWSQQYIHKVLDPSLKQIEKVTQVKSKVGQKSGKILIKFKNEKVRQKYIAKYNEDFLMTETESHRIVILPFELKRINDKRQARQGLNFKNPVRISNLDFDVTKQQLQKLAVDYGQISHIDMYERQSGINRGFATVYFQKRQQAAQFVKFLDGFTYRERKLKAYIIQKSAKKQQKELLKVPSITFKANQQLMKRFKSKEYQVSQKNS